MSEVLLLFGKEPVAGQVKTRLIPLIGALRAAQLYEAFLLDIVERRRDPGLELVLSLAPPFDGPAMERRLPGIVPIEQRGVDLADRLEQAFVRQFARPGVDLVVIRNTDSPLLPVERERQAMRALREGADVVFGPDLGGGYYLVGQSRPIPELFGGVPTSVPGNYEATLARAVDRGLSVATLAAEPDVDDGEDLRLLVECLDRDASARELAPRTTRLLAGWPGL